jgi:hypothetical protein
MKNKVHNTVKYVTVNGGNRGKIDIPGTHIHNHSLSWPGTSIKKKNDWLNLPS